jgi:hypothetical protein
MYSQREVEGQYHRVDRVLTFFSSRPNWDSPSPSPAGECAPPPPLYPGGGYTRLRVRGCGSPNSNDGRKGLAFCLLCALHMGRTFIPTKKRVALTLPSQHWQKNYLYLPHFHSYFCLRTLSFGKLKKEQTAMQNVHIQGTFTAMVRVYGPNN